MNAMFLREKMLRKEKQKAFRKAHPKKKVFKDAKNCKKLGFLLPVKNKKRVYYGCPCIDDDYEESECEKMVRNG
jgi:hypothetical protein